MLVLKSGWGRGVIYSQCMKTKKKRSALLPQARCQNKTTPAVLNQIFIHTWDFCSWVSHAAQQGKGQSGLGSGGGHLASSCVWWLQKCLVAVICCFGDVLVPAPPEFMSLFWVWLFSFFMFWLILVSPCGHIEFQMTPW